MIKHESVYWCNSDQREVILRYAFALFAVGMATWLRVLIHPIIEDRLPFGTYTLAVILVAWVSGARPAILALIASTLFAAHYVIPPQSGLTIHSPADLIALLVFFVVGIISIGLFDRVERQRERAMEQAQENETLNFQLRELDRRKDEFLSLLAHELRSPMAPIRNALVLADKHADNAVERTAVLKVISRNFKHLVRLVDDLLDVSRYLRGSLILRRQEINLCECVSSAIEMNRDYLEAKRHQLTVDLPSEPVHVFADSVRCSQIVCNLLSNAIKYTPDNGRIDISLNIGPESIEVAIRDNGLGIPASIRERIFEPFFQANAKQTRYASGLGLGLTIVQKLIELHEGRLEVSSDGANAGSRFSILLPVSMLRSQGVCAEQTQRSRFAQLPVEKDDATSDCTASDTLRSKSDLSRYDFNRYDFSEGNFSGPAVMKSCEESMTDTVRMSNVKQQPPRVLVVDDDVDTASTLSSLLELEGYEIATANSGLEAIRKCESFLPDVILLDIGLPEFNGFQVARQIRSANFGKRIKIIAISGWGAESDRATGVEAGFDVHLVKPVSLGELLPHLENQQPETQHDA